MYQIQVIDNPLTYICEDGNGFTNYSPSAKLFHTKEEAEEFMKKNYPEAKFKIIDYVDDNYYTNGYSA